MKRAAKCAILKFDSGQSIELHDIPDGAEQFRRALYEQLRMVFHGINAETNQQDEIKINMADVASVSVYYQDGTWEHIHRPFLSSNPVN